MFRACAHALRQRRMYGRWKHCYIERECCSFQLIPAFPIRPWQLSMQQLGGGALHPSDCPLQTPRWRQNGQHQTLRSVLTQCLRVVLRRCSRMQPASQTPKQLPGVPFAAHPSQHSQAACSQVGAPVKDYGLYSLYKSYLERKASPPNVRAISVAAWQVLY